MVACGGGMRAGMCGPVWSSVRPGCGAAQPAICVCVACSVCAVVFSEVFGALWGAPCASAIIAFFRNSDEVVVQK